MTVTLSAPWDNRTIVDAAEDKKAVAQEKLQELTKLFERLRAILELQTQARATTFAPKAGVRESSTSIWRRISPGAISFFSMSNSRTAVSMTS